MNATSTSATRRVTDWPPEALERYWRHRSSTARTQGEYFSAQVGAGIVRLLALTGRLRGRVLDYGCGPGHLLAHLLRRPLECSGLEFSAEAVRATVERFAGRPNWRGCVLLRDAASLPPGSFDVVTCIEAIEHMNDAQLGEALSNICELLRPGGLALFTTPFAEDLEAGMIYCPFCDVEFHRRQHVRRWDIPTLSGRLEGEGFRILACRNLNLRDLARMDVGALRGWNPARLWRMARLHLGARAARDGSLGFLRAARRGNHLCAIVTRAGSKSTGQLR